MAAEQSSPNIVHIICHDLGRHLRCYGRPDVSSPNLDRLAASGARFANCFGASTPCSPARGCLMTGRYAHSNGQIGLAHRGFPLPDEEQTVVDHLNAAGYVTAHIGLQHERHDPLGNRYQINDQETGRCEAVAEKAAEFLRGRAEEGGAPFYLNAGFFEVHLPFDRPEYRRDDPASVAVPGWMPDNPGVREELARFNGAVWFMDEAVGVVLDALARTGLDERTLVLFTTDHGMAFPRAKGTLYDPGIGVALILRPPPALGSTGLVVDDLVSHIDIAPTFLEAAGAPIPDAMQGRGFWGLLAGGDYERRECVFAEKNFHDAYDPIRGLRTERYKYLRNFEPRPKVILSTDIQGSPASDELWPWAARPREEEELYDLRADPVEMTNIAADPAAASVREELAARLEEWMAETKDPLLDGPMAAPPEAQVDAPEPPLAPEE
jgi:arylsulfatase A-like enzyme